MSATVLEGDALERLRGLADESVQCVITSPPYWGLRDYPTGSWEGGSEGCDHKRATRHQAQGATSARAGRANVDEQRNENFRERCEKCGARRVDRQLGLERTPDEYVTRLVDVFREVRRVLRPDGTCWLNIGDCYATGAGAVGEAPGGGIQGDRWKMYGPAGNQVPDSKHPNAGVPMTQPNRMPIPGLKAKDLVLVPARLALALQADGWWVRSDVIWAKPNPMPESVTDRPTRSHEHVFMLTKAERYFYDADAIREPCLDISIDREHRARISEHAPPGQSPQRRAKKRTVREGIDTHGGGQGAGEISWDQSGRNKRDVWEVATQPYAEAHFATFPTKLVEPCVLAGSSPQACAVCGAPWRRVARRVESGWDGSRYGERAVAATGGAVSGGTARSTLGSSNGTQTAARVTVGWEPSCAHADGSGRCVVLDPFAGSGTVGVVCEWYGRDFIGIELSSEYAELARGRIAVEGVLRRPAARRRVDEAQLDLLSEPAIID